MLTPLVNIALSLLQYGIANSIVQYQYLLTVMATTCVIFCFYTHYPKAKHLVAVAMLLTILNFTVGFMLNISIFTPDSDIAIYYAMSPSMNLFFIATQITLSMLAYLFIVMAFYVANI